MKKKIYIYLLTLLCIPWVAGQVGWDQQTACPGWNNPSSFVTGNPDYYYRGRSGTRINGTPDATTGFLGVNYTASYPAENLTSVLHPGDGSSNLLPSPTRCFLIMDDTLGHDPNTDNHLPYVPTHFNTQDDDPFFANTHITKSIRIGTANTGSSSAHALEYHMRVTPNNAILMLYYALVIESPNHGSEANPTFSIRVMRRNPSGVWEAISDTLTYCMSFSPQEIVPESDPNSVGWHYNVDSLNENYYKDWTKVAIDLTPYLYEDVYIDIAVSKCLYGAHYAYAYIAGECRPATVRIDACPGATSTDVAELRAPSSLLGYRWLASEWGAAAPVTSLYPGGECDHFTFSPLTPTIGNDSGSRYAVQTADFHVSQRRNAAGQTITIDSMGTTQTFCCEMTSALDPAKPIKSRIYANVSNTLPVQVVDTMIRCDGNVRLTNLSYVPGSSTAVDSARTEWLFYADGNFGTTPLDSLVGAHVDFNLGSHAEVGVLMRTFVEYWTEECMREMRFSVHAKTMPNLVIEGQTNVARDSLTNLTASSTTPGATFQWSTTMGTVSGNLPAGPRLEVEPYADIATYYICVSAPGFCERWDSVMLFRYSPEGREAASRIFSQIHIDSVACLGSTIHVAIGTDPNNEVVILNHSSSLSHPEVSFLPDGIPCDGECSYRVPVTFDNFPDGAVVSSTEEIRYVRVNMEHSYLGDIYINITCPNGQKASLMRYGGTGSSACNMQIPQSHRGWLPGTNASTSTYLGEPIDVESSLYPCDSSAMGNEKGRGWNYCWSNSTTHGYSYAPGDGIFYRAANVTSAGIHSTIDSSNVAAGTNFYHPDQSFDSLIGCPLNGEWAIEVMDGWANDNGYIFDWGLSLTINTVDGIYITRTDIMGSSVVRINDSTFNISAPPEATGDTTVPYRLLLFDSIGLVADSVIYIHYIPSINVYEEHEACDGDTLWAVGQPYTESIRFIDTATSPMGCPLYTDWNLIFHPVYDIYDTAQRCENESLDYGGIHFLRPGNYTIERQTTEGCDSTTHLSLQVIDSGFHAAFEISDDGERWSRDTMLAACNPYDVQLHDLSPLGAHAEWSTGDGATIEGDSVIHTYDSTGVFSVVLMSTSPHGCHDTLMMKNSVWVFEKAKATFSWSPEMPVMSHPETEFIVDSAVDGQHYMWLLQRTDGLGYDTLYNDHPIYSWGDVEALPMGDYEAVLSTILYHIGPYGDTLTCTDTSIQTVTIVNDWLQFPNLVTPNGDGNNDYWKVVNLLECGQYTMNELWIYDRWGHQVYHAKNISREEDFWYPEEGNIPDGTYYFRFSAKSLFGIVKRNGVIEVVR